MNKIKSNQGTLRKFDVGCLYCLCSFSYAPKINYFLTLKNTRRIKAAAMQRVTISLGKTENPNAPKAESGKAVRQNHPTASHFICFKPVPIREMFPINWASVSTGTAISAPTQAVATGSNRSAPPKPAAPDIRAAIRLHDNKIMNIHISIKKPRNLAPGSNSQELIFPICILPLICYFKKRITSISSDVIDSLFVFFIFVAIFVIKVIEYTASAIFTAIST